MKYIAWQILLIGLALFGAGCGDNPIAIEDQAEERDAGAISGAMSSTVSDAIAEIYQDDVPLASADPAPSVDEEEEIVLRIGGMTWPGCAFAVQFALESVDGVVRADVSSEKGLATVNVKKGAVPVQQLIAAVEDFGYNAFLLEQPKAVEASGKSGAMWGSVKE